MVDEIAQYDKLRELFITEKTTVIVVPRQNPENNKQVDKEIKSFVEYYSLCKSVYEVVIQWNHDNVPSSSSSFSLAHTHSKVSFHTNQNSLSTTSSAVNNLRSKQYIYDPQLVKTESKKLQDIVIKYNYYSCYIIFFFFFEHLKVFYFLIRTYTSHATTWHSVTIYGDLPIAR